MLTGPQIKDTFEIPPRDTKWLEFTVNSIDQIFLFDIQVKQILNRIDDIQVYLIDEETWPWYLQYYRAIKSGQSTINLKWNTYLSSKIRWGPIFFKAEKPGKYRLILDNTHSVFTSKTVFVSGSLASKPLEKRPKSTAEPPDQFTFPEVHEKVRKVSLKLFQNGHYSQAIFEALKLLETELKKKSKINKIGESLVNDSLNENNPVIKLNKNKTQEEIDEQRGFRFLFAGAFVGIKNPKSHSIQELRDRVKASEYLSLVSLLLRRLDEAKVRKRKN